MSEPTLTLTYDLLREHIAFYLGYGRTSSAWTSDQTATINDMLDRGLRLFYNPPIVDPETKLSHRWSFIHVVGRLMAKSSVRVYELPDNFGGITSVMTFQGNQGYYELQQMDEAMARVDQQYFVSASHPRFFAIRPVTNHDPALGQRYELVLQPEPDRDYELEYRYVIRPDKLTSSAIYHHGGAPHSQTLEAACLASCELFVEDQKGVQWSNFQTQLLQSISTDSAVEPSYLGYNADHSDGVNGMTRADFRSRDGGTVTINGVEI